MRTVFLLLSAAGLLGWFGPALRVFEGQTPTPTVVPSKVDALYAQEPLVVQRSDTRYHMEADGTGTTLATVAVRVQSESALKQLSVLNVPFAAKSEHVEWVYARVRHGDGSTTETPVTGAIEVVAPVTREAPFYSDLKEMQLPLRDLRVGDTLEWQVRSVRTSAEAPREFWGRRHFSMKASFCRRRWSSRCRRTSMSTSGARP